MNPSIRQPGVPRGTFSVTRRRRRDEFSNASLNRASEVPDQTGKVGVRLVAGRRSQIS